MSTDIRQLLQNLRDGKVSVDDALLEIKKKPFEDIGFAKVDLHRKVRQGAAEVIYGAGKTPGQIAEIVRAMVASGQERILITRMSRDAADFLSGRLADSTYAAGGKISFEYREDARVGLVGGIPSPTGDGTVLVATGGTSDIPVAEEAALTAEILGNRVTRLYDVGVAGLHRLLSHLDELMSARVIIAIAGMEGALASVIGGLVDCPVIAVPTSVGYGASFGGISALLSMLNSCASGVSVVNIDNGFGAGYLASMINHL
ncbi:MAG: nickel pincer cofactor biosynthesis protein LarB [Treponema sp.]|nr:nickel pincer cofactor biosynthesis protein LarB [Treponema sp.]